MSIEARRVPIAIVADDDPDLRLLADLAATMAGCRVVSAVGNGATALAAARAFAPDVALLDVSMPLLTGLQVCAALRADPATAGMRILLVSALTTDRATQAGLDAGADGYVAKPFSPRALANQIRELLATEQITR